MLISREKKLTAGVLCFSLAITVVPLNIFDTVNADTLISYDEGFPSSVKTFRSIEDYEYNVEVNILDQWAGHSNIEITFTNTGDETIHDWYFTFDYNYEIENPYNCYVLEHEDNLYTMGNNDWNQDILPGESVSIGFTAASDDCSDISDEPTFYLLNTKTVEISSSDLACSFEQYSDWTTGFSGALILTNNSDEQIRDWTISFNSSRPISQVDAAVLSTDADGIYTISNDGNNQNIATGQSYRIELQGGEHDPADQFIFTDYTVSAKTLAYTLDEDNNGNGIADVCEIDFNGFITNNTPSGFDDPNITEEPSIIPSGTVDVTPAEDPILTSDLDSDELEAWASSTCLSNKKSSETISFYLNSKQYSFSKVELLLDGNHITYLYDNGNYSACSDDIGGDGLYSGKATVSTSNTGRLIYLIRAVQLDGSYIECEIAIDIIDFEEETFSFNTIVDAVFAYKQTSEYIDNNISSRVESVKNILLQLENEGYVKPGSVYVACDYMVCCDTINGIGIDFICKDEDNSHNSSGVTDDSRGFIYQPDVIKTSKVLYLVAFNGRNDYYKQEENYYSQNGIPVYVDYYPTYFDYMNCLDSGYDVVVIASHGVYDAVSNESRISSGIMVDRKNTNDVVYYNSESKNNLVRFIPTSDPDVFEIAIKSEFFRTKYANNPDCGTIVLFEACSLFGIDGAIYEDFGLALEEIGVRYSAGFVNSVHSTYAREFCRNFIVSYSNGLSADISFNSAIEDVGENDEVYYDNDGIEAYPYSFGDGSCKITTRSIINAGFEYHGVGLGPNVNVYGWETSGDSHIRTKLSSDIFPTEGDYMAMITTGIGSGESAYFASGEGSVIAQSFSVSENVDCMYFDVNMISEEPTEWIGSRYDDTFEVKVVDLDSGTEEIIYCTSINRATWERERVNLNFDGGDSTTYQTGWNTVICDISKYAGKEIKLIFTVYDVGDSDYDTVVLIDNVRVW